MKQGFCPKLFFTAAIFLHLFYGCKKKDPPVLVPVMTTTEVTYSGVFKAVTGGIAVNNGGAKLFSWGVCYGTSSNPDKSGFETFSEMTESDRYTCTINGLKANTKYYIRAFAKNSAGTGYGEELTFTTTSGSEDKRGFNQWLDYGTMSDIDGNTYKTITIGNQIWMAENLSTSKYSDASPIPLIKDDLEWVKLSTPGYCYYKDDKETYKTNYGALYNWFAVNTGKLCPSGWHVPSDADWGTLIMVIGGESNSLQTLKGKGFTIQFGGWRSSDVFIDFGIWGSWWSTTIENTLPGSVDQAYCRVAGNNGNILSRSYRYKKSGLSIRCLKD